MSEPGFPAPDGRAPGEVSRRDCLVSSAGLAVGWSLARAGLPRPRSADFPIPAEKGFSEEWLRTLSARGAPSVLRGEELRWLGMPVGGVGCGELLLAGDGRLFRWELLDPQPGAPPRAEDRHYRAPAEPAAPFYLRLALAVAWRGGGALLTLGRSGFPEVEFHGTFPLASIVYRSRSPALEVELEVHSPFVPLALEDSSLPVTRLALRVRNTGDVALEVTLRARLENPVCRWSDDWSGELVRTTRCVREEHLAALVHGAERRSVPGERVDVGFDDFEREGWAPWLAEGEAFGVGPAAQDDGPPRAGHEGARHADSRRAPAGVAGLGVLTSPEFTIERAWIHFLLGGDARPAEICVELLVDEHVAATLTGADDERLRARSIFVGGLQGQRARLRVADRSTSGSLGIDAIVFSDRQSLEPLERRADHGTLALGVLEPQGELELVPPQGQDAELLEAEPERAEEASLVRRMPLAPGAEDSTRLVLAWHFPNAAPIVEGGPAPRRHYAARFPDALAIARHVAERAPELERATRLWRDTWFDSTLPSWLLERVLAGVATLATTRVRRLEGGGFDDGRGPAVPRPWIWSHAQVAARLFPELERAQRERVDLGRVFDAATGAIDGAAPETQAGALLCVWREHLHAADGAFLARVRTRVRSALERLLALDSDGDGLPDGSYSERLGCEWSGAAPWLGSLYLAGLAAGEALAREAGDAELAARAAARRTAGSEAFVARTFTGEMCASDAAAPACHAAQVVGQMHAHALGLGRILPERVTRVALDAVWRYAFAPDVGPYREHVRARLAGGRWLALPGEAGLIHCTWPKGGPEGLEGAALGTLNECLTGLEHEVAAHLVWEGEVERGLALERAVHERYAPSRRDPWNEIEDDDHAPGGMASYAVFLALCGFELHGPRGHLGFVPRLGAQDFRAAFTAPEGWGSWSQSLASGGALRARLELRYGRLRLATLRVGPTSTRPGALSARLGERVLACDATAEAESLLVRFATPLVLEAGQTLELEARARG